MKTINIKLQTSEVLWSLSFATFSLTQNKSTLPTASAPVLLTLVDAKVTVFGVSFSKHGNQPGY